MPAKLTHDVVATIGTYKDRQTGKEMKRYTTIGKCFTDEDGRQSIKLESVPVSPEWSGWVSLYPVKEREAGPPRQAAPARPAAPAPENDEDEHIPF